MGLGNSVPTTTNLPKGRKNRKKYYNAPLLDKNSCPISDQPFSILEQILSTLSLEDLASLSLTCKLFNNTVGEFLRHECRSRKLQDSLQKFVNTNSCLLTHKEKQLVGTLQVHLSNDSCLTRQGMYMLLHNMNHYKKTVYRVSVVEEKVGFPHRGNDSYVVTMWDANLRREVVWVKSVCWLQVNYTYENVVPGVYAVAMVIKIGERFTWPHRAGEMTEWIVRWPEKKVGGERHIMVSRDWWRCLEKGQTPSTEISQGLRVEWEEVKNWRKTGYIKVEMPEIIVEEKGNIEFDFKDVQCPWWKSDLLIDFIELRKLN